MNQADMEQWLADNKKDDTRVQSHFDVVDATTFEALFSQQERGDLIKELREQESWYAKNAVVDAQARLDTIRANIQTLEQITA